MQTADLISSPERLEEELLLLTTAAKSIRADNRTLLSERTSPIHETRVRETIQQLLKKTVAALGRDGGNGSNRNFTTPSDHSELASLQTQIETLLESFDPTFLDTADPLTNREEIANYHHVLTILKSLIEKIAFEASGAARHGFIHAGVLEELQKHKLNPTLVSAVSSGTLPILEMITAGGLDKIPPEQLEALVQQVATLDIFGTNAPRKLWQALCNSEILEAYLQEHSRDPETTQLLTLGDIPEDQHRVFITCCNAQTLERTTFSNTNPDHHHLPLYLVALASCAWIPFFKKVKLPLNGHTAQFIDGNFCGGAFLSQALSENGADLAIASYANFGPEIYKLPQELVLLVQQLYRPLQALIRKNPVQAYLKLLSLIPENLITDISIAWLATICGIPNRNFYSPEHVIAPLEPKVKSFLTLGDNPDEQLAKAQWLRSLGREYTEKAMPDIWRDLPITRIIHDLEFGPEVAPRDIHKELAKAKQIMAENGIPPIDTQPAPVH